MDFVLSWKLVRFKMPYMQFLFVRPRFCPSWTFHPSIQLPSDSTSLWTPLPSANSSYCQVCSGFSPHDCHPAETGKLVNGRQSSFVLTVGMAVWSVTQYVKVFALYSGLQIKILNCLRKIILFRLSRILKAISRQLDIENQIERPHNRLQACRAVFFVITIPLIALQHIHCWLHVPKLFRQLVPKEFLCTQLFYW